MSNYKNLKKTILLFGALALLSTGCVETTIVSNKSTDFDQRFKKVLMVYNADPTLKAYFGALNGELNVLFASNKVASYTYFVNPVALDPEKELKSAMDEYQPDAVMFFAPKGGTLTSQGWGQKTLTGLSLDIKIIVPSRTTPVWRASTEVDGGTVGIELGAKKTANAIVNKLKQDKLLD